MTASVQTVTELPRLPLRRPTSHKGDFGRVLLFAGSRGMSGAAVLSGRAALRSGAGLVYLGVPDGIQSEVAAADPCYLTLPLAQDKAGRFANITDAALAAAEGKTAVALGPGLGRSRTLDGVVRALVENLPVPLILDADGLNALEGRLPRWPHDMPSRVFTPHPGELARLLGVTTDKVSAHRESLAITFAQTHQVILVLKGHQTLVTDGSRLYRNATGNPGMATGGTGDVLTGMITALVGQGLPPFEAAQLGVHLHGLTGDLARAQFGEVSLIASDLIDYLPRAFQQQMG